MVAEVEIKQKTARGFALLSGGLDSQLAVCVLRAAGAMVEGVVFASPFFSTEAAERAAKQLNIPLHCVDFTDDILALVKAPRHGFGGALNPCIDCHARMILRAGEMMRAAGYDFVATGEVLNQRPMSQNRQSLGVVERDSTLAGRLLRPLCAKHLTPTIPETEGLIDREKLLDFSGRSRKPQMALAETFGLTEYPSPAGGCLLTEKGFSKKLADLRDHEGLDDRRLVKLLTLGRHFRLPDGGACILGRDNRDNAALQSARLAGDALVRTVNVPGPTALVPGGASSADLAVVCSMCAAYSKHDRCPGKITVRVIYNGAETLGEIKPPESRDPFIAMMIS